MKYFNLFILIILLTFCSNEKNKKSKNEIVKVNQIVVSGIQSKFDSLEIVGSVLIFDVQKNIYYSNDFGWATKGRLPASTFKIANSIIALETGVVENERSIFEWNGEKRWMKQWEQDLNLKDAFQFSCVPCFQDVARKIGEVRMNSYLDKFEYGVMDVDSNNIDKFWLEGKSRIDQFQQINFLKRLYNSQLPISKRTEGIIKKIMIIEDRENYRLSGKTGWSDSRGKNNGWFVGCLELGGFTYIFATNVEPKERFNMENFPNIRKKITDIAFKELGIF